MKSDMIQGFTLLEVVLTISMMGLIVGVGTPVLMAGYQSFLLGTAIQDIDARARFAMERMLRELRTAQIDLPFGANSISLDNGAIRYVFHGGNTLTRNGILMAENVTGTFTVIPDPPVHTDPPTPVHVSVDMTITDGGQSIQLKGGVSPRNP